MAEVSMQGAGDLRTRHVISRELSWLEFNQRVLDEAVNPFHPVFERMKFLSIVASNLDEFFMIRVASLWQRHDAGVTKPDTAGYSPREQITAISERAHTMMKQMYDVLRGEILPELAVSGIRFVEWKDLTREQEQWLDGYFEEYVYPVLTPMAVDSARPFPLILSRSLNVGLLIRAENEEEPMFATVQVPSGLPRVIALPDGDNRTFVLLEQVITRNISRLFAGHEILCCHPYRITRDADLSFDEEDADDLRKEIERTIKKRRWGAAVRLEIEHRADRRLVKALEKALELEDGEVYFVRGPINLDFLLKEIYKLNGFEALKFPPYRQRRLELEDGESMFDRIRKGDILLYHPYDSFDPVVKFIRQAARDPKVLAIKQTLYRVSSGSPIIEALAAAADAGKQVTVLVELKARFDEENNIHWGRRLEQAGAHVTYGFVGLKTHAKIALVVRAEQDGIKRYVHMATGNYNDVTAKIYTDHSLFTCNKRIGSDATAFFNMLTGYTEPPELKKLVYAPNHLRDTFLRLIDREAENARQGRKAEIFAKMNSLVDEEIIAALYRASMAGVRIKLLIRGICCLRPGMEGVSERITVRSIVGRYLEHSRIYCFCNDGKQEVYLSSADWMPRNLDRRVELMFPVEEEQLKGKVLSSLKLQWRDNTQAREMQPDGRYVRLFKEGEAHVSSQEELMKQEF